MKSPLQKLKKLRGRGAGELRVRGGQALAALSERWGVSRRARVPAGDALFRLVAPHGLDGREVSAESLLEHFRARTSPRFFASFDDAEETAAAWRRRFGREALEELVRRADDIVAGRFDLLGLRGLRFDGRGSEADASEFEIDWHLEPLSGKRAPLIHWSRVEYLNPSAVGDKKITWELNRHQHFLRLGRAYLLTRDERYADAFAVHLGSWADANPPKLGINWASSLEVAFRSISWLWALHFFKRSPALTPELFARAVGLLVVHARHLETYLSTYFSPNTHLTGEALGLFYLGTLLPELREAARWRERGWRVLLEELERQVRPDGVYFEQASYYQRYTVDFYAHLLLLARRNDLHTGERLEAKLNALLTHLMHVTRPDGRATLYGDDDGGRLAPLDERPADDFRAALSTAAVIFERADYKHVAREPAEETLWLLGPRGLDAFEELRARPPAETSRAFTDGGVYVMRDGWREDSNYLLLDCGPHGALANGHSHADALSFELAARGRAVLLDPGTYTYTGSAAERDRFRSTSAHNALVVEGESSSEPGHAFGWRTEAQARALAWLCAERFDFFEGEHDGYARLPRPARHRRAVLFIKRDYWLLRDRVEGAGARRCELYFHFPPDAAPRVEGDEHDGGRAAPRVSERPDNSAGLDLYTFGGGAWREERGFVSRCYGSREPAPVLVYEAHAEGPQEFFTFLLPRAVENFDAEATRAREIEAAGGRAFELRGPRSLDLLLASDGRRTAETSRLSSDFELTWARFSQDGTALKELVLIGGRRLALDGRALVDARERLSYA
ncbi:MAG TPA: alginate lyase family protein, partial [Pyrinomonadaceae bacterium]|nr:alginate lyase family protein [Pyrinomonadaceae bacterium]